LFSRLIEALHLNADSRIIYALVLKVDALQPHNVLVAGLVSLGYAGMLLLGGYWTLAGTLLGRVSDSDLDESVASVRTL
ncbi:MAG TPA: hypothetical protein VN039_10975, partial [Nitrospira sp.]|nr:hypothetical protein [Nitrospira sp.]